MASSPAGPDAHITNMLAEAAEIYSSGWFRATVGKLYEAAEMIEHMPRDGGGFNWE